MAHNQQVSSTFIWKYTYVAWPFTILQNDNITRRKYKGKHNYSTIEPGCCGAFEIIAFIYNSVLHSRTEYVCPKFLWLLQSPWTFYDGVRFKSQYFTDRRYYLYCHQDFANLAVSTSSNIVISRWNYLVLKIFIWLKIF